MTNRRQFIAATAGFTLLPFAAVGAGTQVLGVYRRGIGEITVTTLLDGYLALDPNMLQGSSPDSNRNLLEAAFLANGPVDTSINAYVIQTGERTIVVDGGAASAMGPTAGRMRVALAGAGIAPDSVDTLFCTHLHPDHIGAFMRDGKAAFPNAELAVTQLEHDFWTNASNFSGADAMVQGFAAMAQGAVAGYADRLKLVADGDEIAPGISVKHMPGHTPGHAGLMLSSGDENLLIWGDIVHVGPIQFARPEVTIPFDVDQELAAKTRASVLDMVAMDRLEIAGSHIDFPSFGHVERFGPTYRFTPARWDHVL